MNRISLESELSIWRMAHEMQFAPVMEIIRTLDHLVLDAIFYETLCLNCNHKDPWLCGCHRRMEKSIISRSALSQYCFLKEVSWDSDCLCSRIMNQGLAVSNWGVANQNWVGNDDVRIIERNNKFNRK